MTLQAQPVFLIGAPRSGTTICFDMLTTHSNVAIATNYDDVLSRTPAFGMVSAVCSGRLLRSGLGTHGAERGFERLTRLAPRKTEMFRFWNRAAGEQFLRGYLWNSVPGPDIAQRIQNKVLRLAKLQGTSHFALKLTGPGRIRYLNALFPGAKFIHLTRAPEAQVASLLKTAFWRNGNGMSKIWWHHGIPDDWLAFLQRAEATGSAVALAAAQWTSVVNSIRTEADTVLSSDSYTEIAYEDFVNAPQETVNRLWRFAGLEADDGIGQRIGNFAIRKGNNDKWKTSFAAEEIETLRDWTRPDNPLAPTPRDRTGKANRSPENLLQT